MNKLAGYTCGFYRTQKTTKSVFEIIFFRQYDSLFQPYLHYNLVDRISDKNDVLVITTATRFKLTKRAAITFEYGYRAIKNSRTPYYDSMGVGFDIETGGHVFQFFVSNSFGLLENQFLTRTNTSWSDMGIRLGFNISRVFTI
jgi:hypothetical protein